MHQAQQNINLFGFTVKCNFKYITRIVFRLTYLNQISEDLNAVVPLFLEQNKMFLCRSLIHLIHHLKMYGNGTYVVRDLW